MVHPIRHQVNSRVLHKGLFTDEQLIPAFPAVYATPTASSTRIDVVVGVISAAVFLLPVGAMIIDNRAGQLLHGHIAAWLAYRRAVGMYDPGAGDRAVGYELHADEDAVLAAGTPTPCELRAVLGE